MKNFLDPNLSHGDLCGMSTLGLAHIGDAVFELMVRTWLSTNGKMTAKQLHAGTVSYVSAKAQAAAAARVLPQLTDDEHSIFKRGRNAHVNSVPRGSTYEEYHTATGIEALLGYLYLRGETERLNELFNIFVT